MIFLNPSEIKKSSKWIVETAEQEGDTRYSNMKGEHVNFIVPSFWEQGYLAEYIHKLIQDEQNYLYYDAAKLKKMAYDAIKDGKLTREEIKNDGSWKRAIKEMEEIYGEIA